MSKQPVGSLTRLRQRLAAFVEDQRRGAMTARLLSGIEPHERAGILGDAGLQPGEIASAMRFPSASRDLLSLAIQAVGANPVAFRLRHGLWHRDMQRLCMACPARNRCRRDLATHDFACRHRSYCLNAASLEEIVADTGAEMPAMQSAARA